MPPLFVLPVCVPGGDDAAQAQTTDGGDDSLPPAAPADLKSSKSNADGSEGPGRLGALHGIALPKLSRCHFLCAAKVIPTACTRVHCVPLCVQVPPPLARASLVTRVTRVRLRHLVPRSSSSSSRSSTNNSRRRAARAMLACSAAW
jgi:hypothetical protein